MPTQSRRGSLSQCSSGGGPAKSSQASANRATSEARSGFARAMPSISHGPPSPSSNALTASKSPRASVAAAAAIASGAASVTRHNPSARDNLSGFRDKAVHHHLVAGLVEGNGELATFGGAHGAIAEFLMKDAVAGDIANRRTRPFGGYEARRLGAAAKERRARTPGFLQRRRAWIKPRLGDGIDVILGQLADEARRQRALPLTTHTAIGGIGDESAPPGARQPDISEAALFFEALQPSLIHGPL